MRSLVVLYDARCGFCVRCRDWLRTQPTFFPLEFLYTDSAAVAKRFPGVVRPGPPELIAIDERGGVYRDARAWILCLYALRDYREWALRLSSPALYPVARKFFETISASRGVLSWLFGLAPEAELERLVLENRKLGSISVQPATQAGNPRCGYCHDDALGDEARLCPRCRAVLHADCFGELGRCPTLGCA